MAFRAGVGPVEEHFPSMSEALGFHPNPYKKGTGVQAICVYTPMLPLLLCDLEDILQPL